MWPLWKSLEGLRFSPTDQAGKNRMMDFRTEMTHGTFIGTRQTRSWLKGHAMHLAVLWEVRVSGEQAAAVEQSLRDALKGYSWVNPLSSYYVVQVGGESDRQLIRERLLTFARANSGVVRFLITPLMKGNYTGWLQGSAWPKLRERTREGEKVEGNEKTSPNQPA
jgi:hypothetical protein